MTTKERINEVFQRFNIGLKATDEVATEGTNLEAQAVLDNGTIIHTDAESFEEGADVFIINEEGERIPLPEGDYKMQDGTSLVVLEGGKVGKSVSKGDDGKEGVDSKPVAEGQAPKGKAPVKEAKPKAPAPKGKAKKSADAKLAEDDEEIEEEVKEEEVKEEEMMDEAFIIDLINKVLDERFPAEEVEELSTEDTLEVEFEVELSELDQLKAQLSNQETELTTLKSEAASEGIRRAATTEAKVAPVDLTSLSTDERIKALFNQFNK